MELISPSKDLQETHVVTGKPHVWRGCIIRCMDRNLQRHRAALPAIARLSSLN